MSCGTVQELLAGYLDRELDPASVRTVEAHLKRCGQCRGRFEAQSAISASLRRHATYHLAPPALANRIRHQVAPNVSEEPRPTPARTRTAFEWRRWFKPAGFAAAMAMTAVMSSVVTLHMSAVAPEESLTEQLLAGHSRAVLTSHTLDVASSDQHSVKPWLSSRLDFSPVVPDLTSVGFPLHGGRLDYIDHHPAAVLVYARRQHVIDLFVWPDEASANPLQNRSFSKRGLNVVHWKAGDMTYWAVSDVNATDLNAFAEAYKSAM
jgi:anti-sigma factor RsiW